ncbi:unnamed protein product [Durusdinium trenchii]|uniref:Uncharacterized protein n=2 Tax=Durusdinium trenchii TaxID=1381693 RepID=A0ABP0LT86_9DINO
MFRSLGRSLQLLQRASGSAIIFGAGYGCCWAQGREESVEKLATWGAAASFAYSLRGLRYLSRALPNEAEWPRQKLQEVETMELHWLCGLIDHCKENGLDSPILQQLLLFMLCEHAEADPYGLAVQGLQRGKSSSRTKWLPLSTSFSRPLPQELAQRIEDAAKGSEPTDSPPPSHLLPIFSSALASLLTVPGSKKLREDLGPKGALQVAKSAVIATSWIASDTPGQARQGLQPEEKDQVSSELSTVWKALCKSTAAGAHRPSEWRQLQARLDGFKDQLPKEVRPSVEAFAMKGVGGSGQVRRLLDCLSWAALGFFFLALSSEDGLGLVRFHVVPQAWQSMVKDMLQQRALRVEELLAKHDLPPPPPEPVQSIGWDSMTEYLQGPLFRGNGQT